MKNKYTGEWHITAAALGTLQPDYFKGQDIYSFQVTFDKELVETIYNPDTIIMALGKAGALIGLSRAFVIVSLIH